jgi:hypothetical protein
MIFYLFLEPASPNQITFNLIMKDDIEGKYDQIQCSKAVQSYAENNYKVTPNYLEMLYEFLDRHNHRRFCWCKHRHS